MFNYLSWCICKDAIRYTFCIYAQTSTVFLQSLYEFSPIKLELWCVLFKWTQYMCLYFSPSSSPLFFTCTFQCSLASCVMPRYFAVWVGVRYGFAIHNYQYARWDNKFHDKIATYLIAEYHHDRLPSTPLGKVCICSGVFCVSYYVDTGAYLPLMAVMWIGVHHVTNSTSAANSLLLEHSYFGSVENKR